MTVAISHLYTLGYNTLKPQAREASLWEAWQEDDLERVCGRASTEFKPVGITLQSDKVYVGLIGDTLEPSSVNAYLSILPLYSGYRSKDERQFKLIHRYDHLIDGFLNTAETDKSRWLDYLIVIPRDQIVTLHIFNDHLYNQISTSPPPS